MNTSKNIGTQLACWRIQKGLSQEKMAEMVCVSTRALQSWEAGKKTPRVDALIRCANLMGTSLDILTGRALE